MKTVILIMLIACAGCVGVVNFGDHNTIDTEKTSANEITTDAKADMTGD